MNGGQEIRSRNRFQFLLAAFDPNAESNFHCEKRIAIGLARFTAILTEYGFFCHSFNSKLFLVAMWFCTLKLESDTSIPRSTYAMPPFTRRTCPETQPLAGELKNAMTSPISSGLAKRPSGLRFFMAFSTGSGLPRVNRTVSVGPGATALMVISLGPSSLARTRTVCSMAPFVVK
ncbi:hypothetical protein DTO013E5_9271 [Penicillium roqueforti]|nr:hypothetical protein CBS147337_7117 [Penicillium roqueforti]KAI2700058.1 hypothetical protein CBS147372_5675 [Penicillium roqueforti]KAI2728961.1 hypothetical protein CBS147354_2208 [Penicillium roqueforti]KAI2735550.1 hypothetical protein DTO012A1_9146 [Penicillium roqueforti]KAI2747277.1 hypothetical protein DTO013F2_6621 [Penicillium roqueforti]